MAFTPDQRSRLKARTQELVAAGMAPGPAAQQSYQELLASNPEVAQQFQPVEPIMTAEETTAMEREKEREDFLRETAQIQEAPTGSVEAESERYRRRRAAELKSQNPNLSNAAAEAIAAQEVEQEFLQPTPFGFGTPEERAEEQTGVRAAEAVAGAVPVIGSALERQVEEVVPPPRPKEEEAIGMPGVTVDWNAVQKQFVDELQIPENEAAADVDSFKQNFYRPALDAAREDGLSGEEAVQAALTSSFAEFSDMGRRLSDKETYIRDESSLSGPEDPWYRTFTQQEDIGEGIPDLTPGQRAYLNDREERFIQAETDRVLATSPTTDLFGGDFRQMTREEVEEQVREQSQTWWLQEDFQERINRPDIYTDYGFFENVSPLGTRQETVSGWMLRSALAGFNIVPGLIAEAVAPGEESVEYDFTDRVLTNVAENRGFGGEGQAIMAEKGITAEENPLAYYAGTTFGFALDILDPSIDIAKAVGVGTTAAREYGTVVGRLYGPGPVSLSESAKVGYRFARQSLYNDYIIHNLVGAKYDAGTVRNIAANRLRRDVDGAVRAEQALLKDPDALVDDLLDEIEDLKGTPYYNFMSTRRGEVLEDAVEQAKNIIKASDNVLDQSARIAQDLENMARGGQPINLSRTQVSRAVRSLAVVNERVKDAFKSGGIREILADDELAPLLRQTLSADVAIDAVAKSTKDLPAAIDDIVALTDNTYAGRKAAKEILERVKDSEIGQLLSTLPSDDITLMVSNSRVSSVNPAIPGYRLTEEKTSEIYNAVNELKQLGIINARRAEQLMVSVSKNNAIAVDDVRLLLDKMTDAFAEARAVRPGRASSVLRSPEIRQLTPKRQIELLEPFERRTFTSRALGDIFAKLRGDKPIELFAGPAQRNMIARAAVEGKNIVKRLGSLMNSLMKDLDTQKAYGIVDDAATEAAQISSQQALSYAILGTGFKLGDDAININKGILIDTLRSTFKTDDTIENLFDNLTGTNVKANTSPLSDDLFKEIDEMLENAAVRLIDNKGTFFEEISTLINKVEELKSTSPNLFRGNVDDIKPFKTPDGKIPTELQIIPYIKAEAGRVIDKVMEDFVEKALDDFGGPDFINQINPRVVPVDIGGQTAMFTRGVDPLQADALQSVYRPERMNRTGTGRLGLTEGEFPVTLTGIAIRAKMQGRNVLEEWISGGRGIPYGFDAPLARYPFTEEEVEVALKVGNDLADVIMRANKIVPGDLNVNQIEDLIETVLKKPSGRASIKALYGDDIADQLITSFEEGFKGARDQLIEDLRLAYGSASKGDKAVRQIKNLVDAFQNLRYLIMLNMRPRFHAVNLITGSEVFYQNLGTVPSIKDLIDAPRIMTGQIPQNTVALRTPSGKEYTAGELLRILQDATGQSVYKPELFNNPDDINKIRRLIEGTKEPAAMRAVVDTFKELPQNEDLIFRYAALAKGLREGRSESEAIEMARKAMFDRADVTNLERKSIGRAALFYSFARSALATGLRNLTSIKGIKRIKNVARTKDYLQDMALPPGTSDREIADFAPNYAQARVVTGVKPIDAPKGKYEIMTSPAIPTLQNFETFAELLKGNIAGITSGFLSPEYKYLFNTQDPFAREYEEVPAEHLAILDSISNTSGFDTTESVITLIMNTFGGNPSNIVPTPQKAPDGSTYVSYKFATPSQKKAYANFMFLMGISGLTTITSDLGRAIPTEQPVKGAGTDALQDALGFTPMSASTPEKQAFFDRLGRMKAIRDAANRLRQAENERIEAVVPVQDATREVEETIQEARETRQEIERQLPEEVKGVIRMRELQRELRDPGLPLEERMRKINELQRLARELQ